MNIFKDKAIAFLNSYYYPVLLFFVALISHTFSIEMFGASVIILTGCLGLILCNDLKFLISPVIMFILMFSEKSVSSGMYYETPYKVAMVIVGAVVASVFVAHFIIHKRDVNFKSFLKSKLFWGYIALCSSFLLNGLFNFDEYIVYNIIYAIILCVTLGLVFFLFYSNLNCTQDIKKYLFFVLFLVSMLVTLELFIGFSGQIRIENGEIVKESIMLGWGMWNNIGGMMAFLLPIHFYFASTVKKYGWVFYLTAIISYLAIVLTLSRSSLLVSTLMIVASALISCFKGENKKANRIMTGAVCLIGIIGIIVLWDKISSILGDYLARGFDDNGRFEMYEHGIKNFLANPIFGGGFYSAYVLEHQFISFLPFRYHNTIIQMLGTCGIVGISAYLFHRYQTIRLAWKKRSFYTLFACLAILSMLLCSLLDNHFFNLYPTMIYSIILVVIEKTEV